MRTKNVRILFFVLCVASALCVTSRSSAEDLYTVTRIIDGDTVQLNDGQIVRLVGVDTPESYSTSKLSKDADRSHRDKETIRALGKQASEFTRKLLYGKKVRLEYDQRRKGRYGRTLAYLILPDGINANEEIVRQGYGVAYTKYPFKYMDDFRAAEKNARENKRGLWADGGQP